MDFIYLFLLPLGSQYSKNKWETLTCFSCMHQEKYLLCASWLLLCIATEDNDCYPGLCNSIMVYTQKPQKTLVSMLEDTTNIKIRIESSLLLFMSTLKCNRNLEQKNAKKMILNLCLLKGIATDSAGTCSELWYLSIQSAWWVAISACCCKARYFFYLVSDGQQ